MASIACLTVALLADVADAARGFYCEVHTDRPLGRMCTLSGWEVAQMIPLMTIRELFHYNYWARDRQLEACAQVSPEQFLRPMGNSFSSLRDTLAHLVFAEWIWLERWCGKSPTSKEATQEFAADKFPTLTTVRERWQEVETGVRQYLAALSEEALVQPLTYVNVRGETWTYSLGQTLFHVVNHQTYHRGRVTTLLRQLGAQAVPVDYLVSQDLRFQKTQSA